MSSYFGSGKRKGGKYIEIQQGASDSDEFSLSEDEKVLFKKTGEIELNLHPETRIKRVKHEKSRCRTVLVLFSIFVVLISLVVVVAVYAKNFQEKPSSSSGLKKTEPETVQDEKVGENLSVKENGGWKMTFKEMGGEGSARLLDVNQDGIDDIIFASSAALQDAFIQHAEVKTFDVLHQYCKLMGKDYPCMGNIIAVNGVNGSQLWSMKTRSEAFVMNCEDFDVNKDGKKDCIATGRTGQMAAFDPYKGETLWTCEDDELFEAYWNTYHALALPDWDNDSVPEVLIANGGDMTKQPNEHDRDPGRLVVLSGATGKPVSRRYLEIPKRKETYMSPVMFTPVDGKTSYILIGSGGETVSGDLMGISVTDFCHYILGDDAEVCGESLPDEYRGLNKDENGIFVIHSGEEKGVMVPPIIVDYDSDGVRDILMTSFEGINRLYSGKDLHTIWTANFSGMETYGTPAPGYFDDDEYIDFMVTWNYGIWMEYYSVYVYVISGKDGSILWTLQSSFMQMSSSYSIATNQNHRNAFLFKVQGRDSKFKKTKDGLKKPDSKKLHKRHGEGGEPPDIRPSTVESRRQTFYNDFNCDDDLSTYSGEVFLVDRDTVLTPYRILEIPTKKHTYDAALNCSLNPSSEGHFAPVHNHGNIDNQDNSKPFQDEDWRQSSDEHVEDDHDDDSDDGEIDEDDGNIDDDDDDDNVSKAGDNHESAAGNTGLDGTANENDSNSKSEDDPVNTENENTVPGREGTSHNLRRRGRDVQKTKKMCAVEQPDDMSSGIIGDVDGDGKLDFISITSAVVIMYDAEYCPQGMTAELTVQKVDLEKGLLQGSFKQVPVKAKTSMKNTEVKTPSQKEKIFRPVSEQKWTQYFGTRDNNVYK